MSVKFYHALNSSRTIKMDGFRFSFDPYQYLGGTWHGVYRTDNEKEQAALGKLVADPRSAVTETSQVDFDTAMRKKNYLAQSMGVLVPAPPVQADQSPLMPQSAPPVGDPSSSEFPAPVSVEVKLLDKADEALSVGPVSTTPAPAPLETTGCDLV